MTSLGLYYDPLMSEVAEWFRDLDEIVLAMNAQVVSNGGRLLVVIFPTRVQADPRDWGLLERFYSLGGSKFRLDYPGTRIRQFCRTHEIDCLDLLPVDKWTVELDAPLGDTVYGSTALRGDNCIDIDAGLITDRTGKMINALANPVPVETWTRGGPPPQLNPETQVKLYFVNMHYPTTWGTGPLVATLGMHLTAEIWAHNQYYALRGND